MRPHISSARTARTASALVAATTAVSTALLLGTPGSAGAAGGAPNHKPVAQTLNDTVLAPFQLAVSKGKVYYTDGFAGTISKVARGDDPVVATAPDVAGLEFTSNGKVMAFAAGAGPASTVTLRRAGSPDVVAAVGQYETDHNPDAGQTYGVVAGGNDCANDFFAQITGGPATYTGLVDSHPYQLARLPGGAFAVAEAAGNDILKVDAKGNISTLALLPPQPITVTAEQAAAVGAPDCVVGVTYAFEPVPTDVERDARGNLFVSTLPGGPEGPELGARGSVYKITPGGQVSRVATGFLGATNLAVSKYAIFVAELFGGKITKVHRGRSRTVVRVDSPVSVELRGNDLLVGVLAGFDETGNVTSPGRILRYRR